MKRISDKSPCLNCCSDQQIGNPDVWQNDCYWCEKLPNWKAKVIDRLAAIEDILDDDYDLDRLKELVEADREGKCVVLPCKVGDTVYIPTRFEIAEREVYEIFVENSAKFYAKDNKGIGLSVFFFADDVGKTVFLTREEAEAALEKMKGGNE